MRDTPSEVERKYCEMLMQLSGEERLKMGCSMHATAQALAKAALLQRYPGADPAKLKRLLFLHFYANDFEPEECERVASALERRARAHDRERKVSMSNPAGKVKREIAESNSGPKDPPPVPGSKNLKAKNRSKAIRLLQIRRKIR